MAPWRRTRSRARTRRKLLVLAQGTRLAPVRCTHSRACARRTMLVLARCPRQRARAHCQLQAAGVTNSTRTSALYSILSARGVRCKRWRDVLHHGREHGVGCKRWRIVLNCGRWYCGRHGGDSRRGSWCGVHHSTVLPYRRSDRVRHCKNGAIQQNAAQQRCLSRKRVLISVTNGHGAIADTNQSRPFNLVKAAQSVQSALVVARILHDDCLRLRLAY